MGQKCDLLHLFEEEIAVLDFVLDLIHFHTDFFVRFFVPIQD